MNFLILCLSVKAQRVSDVIVVQDGQKLRIQYLLSTTVPVDVDLYVSDNNGVTWQEVGDFLSGSYGQGISSGRKEIIWDVLQSKEKLVGNSFVFKVKVGSEIRSVKIGNQVWMAENLNVDHYQNGEPILLGITYGDWSGRYVETIINDTQYQRFYNWFAVNDSRGLCPTGWHVPSHYEYLVLEKVLGGAGKAGGRLKELGGFGASLYGGYDFGFSQQGQQGIFWTNTEISDVSAKTVSVSNGLNGLYHIGLPKTTGCSVRCVKD